LFVRFFVAIWIANFY